MVAMINIVIMAALMALAVSAVSVFRGLRIRRDAGFPLSRRRKSALRWMCGL
jgi:hypothetical protein